MNVKAKIARTLVSGGHQPSAQCVRILDPGVFNAVRRFSHSAVAISFLCALALLLSIAAVAHAQGSGGALPGTTITPAGEGGSETPAGAPTAAELPAQPAAEATPRKSTHVPARHHAASHHARTSESASSAVEPAKAKLRLTQDSWAYTSPAKSSKRVEQVHAGKFVNVTGTTRYYVQVQLKSGATAYVPISAVELTRPADKIFTLTSDAAVLSEPSHYGKKLSEVHRGHKVQVIGIALNYAKIRMKDKLEGFIPLTALE
jgi:uncharacterized protein YgiM (DUF1202 family)